MQFSKCKLIYFCQLLSIFYLIIALDVLVSPIRVVKRLSDLSSIEISNLFQTVQKVQRVVERVHSANSSTIAVQDGPDAGQTISVRVT